MGSRRFGHRWVQTISVVALVTLSVLVRPTSPAGADTAPCTTTWIGAVGTWEDATSWSGGRVPTTSDIACVIAGSGPAPVVTVARNESAAAAVVTGATLRVAGGAHLLMREFQATAATLAGPGVVRAQRSQFDGSPTRLAQSGVSGGMLTDGVVVAFDRRDATWSGAIGIAGGSRLISLGHDYYPVSTVTYATGTHISDLDGDPDNKVVMSGMILVPGSATVDVLAGAGDSQNLFWTKVGSGTLTVPRLAWLRPSGTLTARRYSTGECCPDNDLTVTGGSLVVDRNIRTVGPFMDLDIGANGSIRTPTGGDALAGLVSVASAGRVSTKNPLTLRRPLAVGAGGYVYASVLTAPQIDLDHGYLGGAKVNTPLLNVSQGATVGETLTYVPQNALTSVSGTVHSGGYVNVRKTSIGALTLTPTASTLTGLDQAAQVQGAAQLNGEVQVQNDTPYQSLQDGDERVLLTAAGGITGRFSQVTALRPHGASPPFTVTLRYESNRVVAVYHLA